MTREEEIKQASEEVLGTVEYQCGFADGARWADETMIDKACEVKEVDLEKELDVYFDTHDYEFIFDDYIELAKYFFELGLKTQKGK